MRPTEAELWLVTGSQHLYGPEPLRQVAADAEAIAEGLNAEGGLPLELVCKPVVTTSDEIRRLCLEANADERCAGLVTWMHTFSPAKMWIAGLNGLTKPVCHLHTQFNPEIPWDSIDMDFMNLHQSAHGGREFGHVMTRLRKPRAVVVGHWREPGVRAQLADWASVATGWHVMWQLKVVRFGDNMRNVAVTEGDKVDAESVFGMRVNTHGVGDLVERVEAVSDAEAESLCEEYEAAYAVADSLRKGGGRRDSLVYAAKQELGLRGFLEEGGFGAFTDTFEDLHGLRQLPGLAVQRLMAEGYGFGAEGDWRHAALVRVMKAMGGGSGRGTSFMEDYTYHFDPSGARCLGAHMLEICPSIAAEKPSCEIHPLGIGGGEDPVRLVFEGETGPAINASLVDLGNRFRMVVNEVESVGAPEPLPNLPVARVLWDAKPDLRTAAAAWIQAGGAHHTGFSFDVTAPQMEALAEIAGIECVVIDGSTELRRLKQDLRLGEVYYGIRGI